MRDVPVHGTMVVARADDVVCDVLPSSDVDALCHALPKVSFD